MLGFPLSCAMCVAAPRERAARSLTAAIFALVVPLRQQRATRSSERQDPEQRDEPHARMLVPVCTRCDMVLECGAFRSLG